MLGGWVGKLRQGQSNATRGGIGYVHSQMAEMFSLFNGATATS